MKPVARRAPPAQGERAAGLWEPNPNRAAALDDLKKRCEMYANMGLNRVYAATATGKKVTEEDYKAGAENMHKTAGPGTALGMAAVPIRLIRKPPGRAPTYWTTLNL